MQECNGMDGGKANVQFDVFTPRLLINKHTLSCLEGLDIEIGSVDFPKQLGRGIAREGNIVEYDGDLWFMKEEVDLETATEITVCLVSYFIHAPYVLECNNVLYRPAKESWWRREPFCDPDLSRLTEQLQ